VRALRQPSRAGVVAALDPLLQVRRQQVRREPARDDVQHDRRDDLADATGRLQQPGDARPGRADGHRDDDDERDVQRSGQRDGGTRRGGEQRGELVLALHADVEQAHPEARSRPRCRPGRAGRRC
jgi:hypothetical protein